MMLLLPAGVKLMNDLNLFMPSGATWDHNGQTTTVRQETEFPEANDVRFTVQPLQPVKMALSLRAPDWAGEFKIRLNEREEIPFQKNAAGWVVIERVWNPNDVLQVALEPKLHLWAVDQQHPRRCAVKFGPVLLAQEARFTYPLGLSGDDVAGKFKRENEALHFSVQDAGGGGQGTGMFKPFYEAPER